MLSDVTFGITAFERPFHLQQLVSSILHRYPHARIVVADNGSKKATLSKQVKVIHLPFDSGLARTRNALIDSLETKYLLILEDDFLFTSETRIERLVEILGGDEEVGVVGGAVRSRDGRISAYSLDIEIFRDTFYVRESDHRVRISPQGTPYRICDIIWNFALFRADMLRQHRWDDRLKVGEHAPYFHQVKLQAQWRVACCPSVILYHVPDRRSANYQKHRQRAGALFHQYLSRYNLTRYCRIPPMTFVDNMEAKPCVVVMGVGHSGTSILAKMLHAAGWEPGDADSPYGESLMVRNLNQRIEKSGRLPYREAQKALEDLPRPWAIKDPRFVRTLHHWLAPFAVMETPPVLIRIRRDARDVENSYVRRGVGGDVRAMVQQRIEMCERQYSLWPWMRLTIEYEQIRDAVALFDLKRSKASAPSQGSPQQNWSVTTSGLSWQEEDSHPRNLSLRSDASSLFRQSHRDSEVMDQSHALDSQEEDSVQDVRTGFGPEDDGSTL